uniref:Epstein-Barr virus EBNA-1-like protein n=1 Tax=Oryza sativa subsp. japonica TaxID=39947 RepID=Q8LNQ6_ORYSJ|nr:hypothetical protein [Oryza sativa Japonica Group]
MGRRAARASTDRSHRHRRRGGQNRRLGGPEGAADRGQLDPVAAEVVPTWRLRGCHAGRREVDDDVGRNGRLTAAASDCGGGNRRREKGETATVRRETDSGELEHLRDSGNPLLASDWAELRRARPATSGRYGARAATAASTQREAATGGNVGLETDLGRSRRELALGARGQNGDRGG